MLAVSEENLDHYPLYVKGIIYARWILKRQEN